MNITDSICPEQVYPERVYPEIVEGKGRERLKTDRMLKYRELTNFINLELSEK